MRIRRAKKGVPFDKRKGVIFPKNRLREFYSLILNNLKRVVAQIVNFPLTCCRGEIRWARRAWQPGAWWRRQRQLPRALTWPRRLVHICRANQYLQAECSVSTSVCMKTIGIPSVPQVKIMIFPTCNTSAFRYSHLSPFV